jgi:hypothetical protein
MKIVEKEFKGNVLVKVSEKEVRVWVCNANGENIFRFKTIGKVFASDTDIMIIEESEK